MCIDGKSIAGVYFNYRLLRELRFRQGQVIYPAQALKIFMITNNAAIAESDCLFYAVADDCSNLSA